MAFWGGCPSSKKQVLWRLGIHSGFILPCPSVHIHIFTQFYSLWMRVNAGWRRGRPYIESWIWLMVPKGEAQINQKRCLPSPLPFPSIKHKSRLTLWDHHRFSKIAIVQQRWNWWYTSTCQVNTFFFQPSHVLVMKFSKQCCDGGSSDTGERYGSSVLPFKTVFILVMILATFD